MEAKIKKVSKIISNIAIAGLFVSVAIVVLGLIGGLYNLTTPISAIVAIIAFICLSCLLALNWIRRIENKEFVKISWIFFGLVALSCLLWVICTIIVAIMIDKGDTMSASLSSTLLTIIKISAIFTVQFITAQTIADRFSKFRKSYIPFQVVNYLSLLFVDLYVTLFALGFSIRSGELEFVAGLYTNFLFKPLTIAFFVMTLLFILISNIVVKTLEKKKMEVATNFADDSQQNIVKEETVEEKLAKIKDLLDKNIITQEEYDSKRAEILKNI